MAKHDLVTRSTLRFEYLSQKLWPIIRPVAGKLLSKRCRQCVISSKVPGIELTDGICNRCREFNSAPTDSEERRWETCYIEHQARQLDKILRAYQGQGKRRWDALVLFSGGKDSVYMVYRIKKEYPGLRMLAMTWNNGFYSDLALDTAREAAKKLDIDHVVFKPAASVYRNLYRFTLMRVDESGSYGTVDRFDGTLNQHLGLRFGAELEIPLVLTGVDWAQALLMGSLSHFEQSPQELLARVDTDRMERRSGLRVSDIFDEGDQDLYWDGSRWPTERVPRLLLPLVAWRPNKEAVARELSAVGLVLPGHTSPLVTNNQVLSIMSAVDIKKIGYCSFEPEFSDMIRMHRSDATYWRNVFEFLEYVVKRDWSKDRAFTELLGRLGLKPEEIGLG